MIFLLLSKLPRGKLFNDNGRGRLSSVWLQSNKLENIVKKHKFSEFSTRTPTSRIQASTSVVPGTLDCEFPPTMLYEVDARCKHPPTRVFGKIVSRYLIFGLCFAVGEITLVLTDDICWSGTRPRRDYIGSTPPCHRTWPVMSAWIGWFIGYVLHWLVYWLIAGSTGGSIALLISRLVRWLVKILVDSILISGFNSWLVSWFSGCLIGWLIGWLTRYLVLFIDWLTDWCIGGSISSLAQRLVGVLVEILVYSLCINS